jgi:hypothetical protein
VNDSTHDSKREMLRHTLATLAYRCGKTLRDAPEGFGSFRASDTTRTPVEILAHIGDLLDWALWLARGEHVWNDSMPLAWPDETARFFAALRALDEYLASDAPLGSPVEKIFQGPIADALTHTGQIAMLRRMFGAPMRGESYFRSDIVAGRTGPEQTPPRKEFD